MPFSCWDVGGFFGKLVTNVAVITCRRHTRSITTGVGPACDTRTVPVVQVMPVLFIVACGLLYLNQRRTIQAVIAAGGSDESAYRTATVAFQSNLLFGVFLL